MLHRAEWSKTTYGGVFMSLEDWVIKEAREIDDRVAELLDYCESAHGTDYGLETVQIALHNVIENLKAGGWK